MTQESNPFARLANLQEKIAGDVWPDGVTLHCAICDHTEHHDASAAGGFLRAGWPMHCGYTMPLVTKPVEVPLP